MSELTINTDQALQLVLDKVSFAPSCMNLDWKWEMRGVFEMTGEIRGSRTFKPLGWHVRMSFTRPDTETGVIGQGFGRWEFIPLGATESAAVKTCWLLVEFITRHELMEAFHYKGSRIFGPHHTAAELAVVAKLHEIMKRRETEPPLTPAQRRLAGECLEWMHDHGMIEKVANDRPSEATDVLLQRLLQLDRTVLDDLRAYAQQHSVDFYRLVASKALDIHLDKVTDGMRATVKQALFAYTYGSPTGLASQAKEATKEQTRSREAWRADLAASKRAAFTKGLIMNSAGEVDEVIGENINSCREARFSVDLVPERDVLLRRYEKDKNNTYELTAEAALWLSDELRKRAEEVLKRRALKGETT